MNLSYVVNPEEYLENLVDQISISESRYEQAERSYHSLGKWLNRTDSEVKKYSPAIYVQGSFGLGTVIKPLNDSKEYDIDTVCELKSLSNVELTQLDLKKLVGREVDLYKRSKNLSKPVREGRRCWTLYYADGAQFHMDIVPALPCGNSMRILLESRHFDATWADTAISITDNECLEYKHVTNEWPRSNPAGYLKWFQSRMMEVFQKRRKVIAESVNASVEQIPEYKVRTPLQASIMLLKQHRDIKYENDTEHLAPISIIITTLAANAYNGEESISEALKTILEKMDDIHFDGTKYIIPNPTDELENFADKWEEYPERQEEFFNWLEQARSDFNRIFQTNNLDEITEALDTRIGANVVQRTKEAILSKNRPSSLLRPATSVAGSIASSLKPTFGNEPRIPTKPQGFA